MCNVAHMRCGKWRTRGRQERMVRQEWRKPRAEKTRIAGTYPIDTGEARIVADPERDGGYTLEVNRVPSSYVVPGAPEVLEFEYMRDIAEIVAAWAPRPPWTAVHLGAAGCALPSYFAHRFGNRNVAVELDRGLATLVRRAFDPPVELKVADARTFTHALPASSVDVIIRDVFAGPDTPRALTTVEFYRRVRRALRPGGLFVANIGDREGLSETRAELAGLAEVFTFTGAKVAANAYGNVVVAASDAPLPHGLKQGQLLIDAAPARHDPHP